MLTKTLNIAAIEQGSSIDHIPAGFAMHILQLLNLGKHQKKVSVGINLPSQRMGTKDLIKVEDRFLTRMEGNQVAIFAPHATISIIKGYEVVEKYPVTLPKTIEAVLACPNPRCITNHERVPTRFSVQRRGKVVDLHCGFCHQCFPHDEVSKC